MYPMLPSHDACTAVIERVSLRLCSLGMFKAAIMMNANELHNPWIKYANKNGSNQVLKKSAHSTTNKSVVALDGK